MNSWLVVSSKFNSQNSNWGANNTYKKVWDGETRVHKVRIDTYLVADLRPWKDLLLPLSYHSSLCFASCRMTHPSSIKTNISSRSKGIRSLKLNLHWLTNSFGGIGQIGDNSFIDSLGAQKILPWLMIHQNIDAELGSVLRFHLLYLFAHLQLNFEHLNRRLMTLPMAIKHSILSELDKSLLRNLQQQKKHP